MQRQWAETQVQRLSNLEVCVAQCTETVRSTPQHSVVSHFLTIEQHPSESGDGCSTGTDLACPKKDRKQLARSYKKVTNSLKRQKHTLARLQLPSWLRLTSHCVEICGERSLYGMSIDTKVYRIVASDSPIMNYAREGNVTAIQEMFSEGTATPYDMIAEGWDVLIVLVPLYSIGVDRTI